MRTFSGWHGTCKAWNQKRDRQVPEGVIEGMFKSLEDFPPLPAEGFAVVNGVASTDVGFDRQAILDKIQGVQRTLTNRANRTKHRKVTLHRYSRLLDFDRLLHLIALVIRYPGIGALHETHPTLLEKIFGSVPSFATPLEEVCALMGQFNGAIYAVPDEIASDLQWLEQNGLIGSDNIEADLEVAAVSDPNLVTHAYSDIEPFQRLLSTIRFILHHPYLQDLGAGSLKTLVAVLKEHRIVNGDGLNTVRKDIEKVLKPYKILPNFPLRQGYFAGTGILSRSELSKVFGVLQSQAKSLDDPVALAVYEMFRQRMLQSQIDISDVYPVRTIGNRCIVDVDSLPASALSKDLEKLEDAIANGSLLELNRIRGGGRFRGDEDGFFQAWPLQIMFHNLAWYLGLEYEGGLDGNLFRFERLDRLFMGQPQSGRRSRIAQEKSLKRLQRLYEASAGLFLGNSAKEQQQFLSTNKSERSAVEITVELWFNDEKFKFITEGTKRFPLRQMKMSPPVGGWSGLTRSKLLFSLPKTGDPSFPNRFRVVLPKWSLGDVDLWRWVVGFGGNVKVVHPKDLIEKIRTTGEEIIKVYQA